MLACTPRGCVLSHLDPREAGKARSEIAVTVERQKPYDRVAILRVRWMHLHVLGSVLARGSQIP